MLNLNHMNQHRQMSFSCVDYIVTFLVAIQPLTCAARLGYAEVMTAAATIKSPGEMDPKSLSILIGDSANITCRLSKPNSSNIWFLEEKSKQSIKQPSNRIKIIDKYTAVLMVHNANEQNSRYQCKVGDYAIGESELYVGTKPLNVTDFSCISYDYEYMDCTFTRPQNKILTRFDLEYRLPKDSSTYKCNCHSGDNHKLKCNVTDYLPIRDKYVFTLKGTNDVGENVQTFFINNHKIVVPSAVDIVQQNITSNTIALTLEKLKISYYIKIGLTYDIQIRDNSSNWRTPQMGELECQNGKCNIVISNLYAFWLYWVKVKVKSNAVDNDDFWSEDSTIQFRTKPERPIRAPETPVGSFYIDSTETQLRLYWEQIPEHERNGPGFHYVINEVNEHGIVMSSTNAKESSLTFAWKNESMQMFTVKSANDLGASIDENVIRVYRSESFHYELNENNIAKVYHNRSYTLSWSPPDKLEELLNYTVFWCLPKIELPNQCKGPISYKYLNKFATNFTTEPKDRSLNLAISANYPQYNKGMQWARCSGDVSSELMKIELEVNALNKSAIFVKWSSGSVCASILKGYNLTYCQTTMDKKCVTPAITVELLRERKEYRNFTISNLPPFTNVCLSMFMYSSSKQGRISDLNCIRTKASAPLPPQNLMYVGSSITSKSAQIKWSPPDISNGILSHYTIYWRKPKDHIFEKNTTSIEQTSYNLTGLNSYSNYEVYVTAHTIEESLPSRKITFTTLIGIPSGPRNLSIYENDTVIYWEQPDLPSGKHLFYVVALIRRDEKFNLIYERVSIVKGRSCRFQQPDCINSNNSYVLWVRAVNVGGEQEVDQEIVAMDKYSILAGTQIDERFCKEKSDSSLDIDTESIFQNDNGKFYFASPWTVAPRSYSCSTSSKASIYAVALLIAIAFAAYLCCWLRNKIYNMKNIKVILPEGLDSNYKYTSDSLSSRSEMGTSTKKNFHSDISCSNDCLVSYRHKENLNLVTNFHNGSSNALSSLSSSSSAKDHQNENQIGEHPSLETTNEELSSVSSSASIPNFTYYDSCKIKRLSSIDSNHTIPASDCKVKDVMEKDNEKNVEESGQDNTHSQHMPSQKNNGYVMHNSQILASILKAAEINVTPTQQFNQTMTNDGYIQPSVAKQLFQPSFSHHQQQQLPTTSINEYTCIASLEKFISTGGSRQNNSATSQTIANDLVSNSTTINTAPLNDNTITATIASSSLYTSPVITNLYESPVADINKEIIQPNEANISATNTSQQPNNNTIYGYVTQQQLANFGTNVALGKELNT